jgi:hypothetical protein
MRTNNAMHCVTELARAHVCIQEAQIDAAMGHLRNATSYAYLDGDHSRVAAILRARAAVCVLYNSPMVRVVL